MPPVDLGNDFQKKVRIPPFSGSLRSDVEAWEGANGAEDRVTIGI